MLVIDEADDLGGPLTGMKLQMGAAMDLKGDGLGVAHLGDLGRGFAASQRVDQRAGVGQARIVYLRPQAAVHGQCHPLVDRHPSGGADPFGDQTPGALVFLPGQDLSGKTDQPLDLLQLELRCDVVEAT